MARRNGKPGNWLATEDTTGFTRYGTDLRKDFWGNRTAIPLERNLQEISTPLNDPGPVPFYLGPSYETTTGCVGEVAPSFVGTTTVPTSQANMAFQVLDLKPGLGDMSIGCTFQVY